MPPPRDPALHPEQLSAGVLWGGCHLRLMQGKRVITNDTAASDADQMDAHRAAMLAEAAATRETFTAFVTAARTLLAGQPSTNTVWAQARRLAAVVNEIATDVTGGRG